MAPPLLLSSISAVPTPVRLPPTANALNRHHRERLMRSTRKLGDVLGATPLVVQPAPDAHPDNNTRSPRLPTRSRSYSESRSKSKSRSHHQHSLSANRRPSVSSSISSFEIVDITHDLPEPLPPKIKLTKTSHNKPRQLTLYLNTGLASSSDSAFHPPSPSIISVTTAPPSPTLSVFSVVAPTPAPDVIRRRKMAKLKRTLGENVPVELIFRQTESRRAPLASTVPVATRSSKTTASSPPLPSSSLPSVPQVIVTETATSGTSHSQLPTFPMLCTRKQSTCRPGSAAPFSERPGYINSSSAPSDWTGEWNVRDIRLVQKQLRALRKS